MYLNVNYLLDECGRCGERAGRIAEGEHHPLDLGAAMTVLYFTFTINFRSHYIMGLSKHEQGKLT